MFRRRKQRPEPAESPQDVYQGARADAHAGAAEPAESLLDLYQRALADAHAGATDRAVEGFERALAKARSEGNRAGEGAALNWLGLLHEKLGDHAQAYDLCREAATVLREVGDRAGVTASLYNMGTFHRSAGQSDEARARFREARAGRRLWIDAGVPEPHEVSLDGLEDLEVLARATELFDEPCNDCGRPATEPVLSMSGTLQCRPCFDSMMARGEAHMTFGGRASARGELWNHLTGHG